MNRINLRVQLLCVDQNKIKVVALKITNNINVLIKVRLAIYTPW